MNLRKTKEKDVNKNIKTFYLPYCSEKEIENRINNYRYLKTNQKICGVKKTRLNNLLGLGCPYGRKCRSCADQRSIKAYRKEKRSKMNIAENMKEHIFDLDDTEYDISENVDLKCKPVYFADILKFNGI